MGWRTTLTAGAATLALSGCTGDSPAPPHPLALHAWNLVQITPHRGNPIVLPYAQQAQHQLVFTRDGTVQMTLDCNRGNASWTAQRPDRGAGSIEIGRVASTRALCPPPSHGETMASDLPSARRYTLQSDGEAITIETQSGTYSFVASTNGPGSGASNPGSGYQASREVQCSVNGRAPRQRCWAGVIRRWQPDGTTLVEVTKPDGRKRALYFRGIDAYGADSAQSDGSAAWRLRSVRRGDATHIEYGPERYVIPHAFVAG